MTDNDSKMNSGNGDDGILKKVKTVNADKTLTLKAPVEPSSGQLAPDPELTLKAAQEAEKFERLHAEETKAKQAQEEIHRLSEAEAEEAFQKYKASQINTILPNVPDNDMWRYCWVSTNMDVSSDNVSVRMRGGWQLVRWEEVPGFKPEVLNNRSATMGDVISFNEMVLMKIPRAVWEKIMNYNHHTAVLEQEAAVRSRVQEVVQDEKAFNNPEYVSPDLQSYGTHRGKKPTYKGV